MSGVIRMEYLFLMKDVSRFLSLMTGIRFFVGQMFLTRIEKMHSLTWMMTHLAELLRLIFVRMDLLVNLERQSVGALLKFLQLKLQELLCLQLQRQNSRTYML
ncbi:hypothetical protein ER13_16165 [Brevundimonas sp. EAKA]|nr:hypothetical protein ER13_16165 [Brevundimonas sp. EAKA]